MKFIIIISTNLFFLQMSFCQINLIINPGFEDIKSCPNEPQAIDPDLFPSWIDNWFQYKGSSDLYRYDPSGNCINTPFMANFNNPYQGKGYAGIKIGGHDFFAEIGEMLTGSLSSPLIANQEYYFEFYAHSQKGTGVLPNQYANNAEINLFSAYFTIERPVDVPDNYNSVFSNVDNGPVASNQGWVKVYGSFIAKGGELFFTVGKSLLTSYFGDLVEYSQGYYYLDAFKLYPTGNIRPNLCCPDTVCIEDVGTGNNDFLQKKVESTSLIKAGFDVGIPNKEGDVIVKNGQKVEFRAGEEILLVNGFSTELGSEFVATIESCNPFMDFPQPEILFVPNGVGECSKFCIQGEDIFSYKLDMATIQPTQPQYQYYTEGIVRDYSSARICIDVPTYSLRFVWAYYLKVFNCEGDSISKLGNLTVEGCTQKTDYNEEKSESLREDTLNNDPSLTNLFFKVYPSPTDGAINIKYSFKENKEGAIIEILDFQGKIIDKFIPLFGENQQLVNYTFKDAPSGIYFVHLTTNSDHFVEKVFLER